MGANNGKQYGSEGEWAARPHTPGSRPPSFLLALGSGKEGSRPQRWRTPIWHSVPAVTFPSGTECSGAPGCFPTRDGGSRGVLLSNFPGCLWGGSSCNAVVFLNACASTSPPWASGFRMIVWQMVENVFQRNNEVKTFSGLCAPVRSPVAGKKLLKKGVKFPFSAQGPWVTAS